MTTIDPEPAPERIAARYRRFAELEAAGRSSVYADIARHVSRDADTIAFIAALPPAKWQPNLLLGAVQYVHGPVTGRAQFTATLTERADEVARVMLARTTQTNIPARCATLLPALAALPQPLALIEVGASAGLCLYPDRYGYDYGGHHVRPTSGRAAPTFRCAASPGTPLPDRPVEVVWRAGLDLNPLDIGNLDDRAWLDALVWPGEEHLRRQLHAAMDVARADPPHLMAGDLSADLPSLIAQAPSGATLVVFHTAVLAYVRDPQARQRFADTVGSSRAIWLANESPSVIPGLERDVIGAHPADRFLLCRDGVPVARTDPHGGSIHWL